MSFLTGDHIDQMLELFYTHFVNTNLDGSLTVSSSNKRVIEQLLRFKCMSLLITVYESVFRSDGARMDCFNNYEKISPCP